MDWHKAAGAALLSAILCSLAAAQDGGISATISDDEVDPAAMQLESAQPPDVTPDTTPGTLPPVEVEPPAAIDGGAATGGEFLSPFDRPGSFPSLADQFYGEGSAMDLGGLNSVTRGAKSLFDQSNLGTILGREVIEEKQAADMFRALQYEVGVLMQATGRGQASPFIRGVTGQQVLVLIDGIRLNNAILRAGPNQYFNTIDPGQVERIEVLRGGGSVLWGGDAIGGAINIVTRSADPFAADYHGGSFIEYYGTADSSSYSRGNLDSWVGNHGVFGGGSYMNVNELDIGGGRGRQPFTDYDQYAADIKYNLLVGDNQFVTVSFAHFEQQDLPRSDRFAPFVFNRPGNTPRPTFFDPQARDLAYIRYQGEAYNLNSLFDYFSATASYSRTYERSTELRSPTQFDTGSFTDHMPGAQISFAKDNSDIGLGVVTYGAEYYYEDIDAGKVRTNPQNPNQAPQVRVPQYPDDSIYDRAGVFLNWDVYITPNLNASVGTRYESNNVQTTPNITINNVPTDVFFEQTYNDWVGSAGLTYHLTDEINLVGGFYEGYRAPTLDDLVSTTTFLQNAQSNPQLANLGLVPEHSYTYEVGVKLNQDRLRLEIYQWWMEIDDYITRDVDGAGNVILGNHQARLYGTEAVGEYLLPGGWAAYGNFAYTFGNDLTDGAPFTRIPPIQSVAGLRWRDDCRRSYFDVFTWMVGRQDRYNPVNVGDSRFWVNGVPATPGFMTLNLRAGTRLGECDQHRLSVTLENITDRYYRVLGSGVDGAGFNAIFGYEYYR